MTILKNQTNLLIKKIYKCIKTKNLIEFKQFITDNPSLLHIKQKDKSNLLFYCLENQSYEIFFHVFEKKQDLIFQKNMKGINCFHHIIENKNADFIEDFLISASNYPKILNKLLKSKDGKENNLASFMMMQGKDKYHLYKKYFEKDLSLETLENINIDGHSLIHLIAIYNMTFAIGELDKSNLSYKHFNLRDDRGATPFLISAKFADLNLFKKLAEKSDIQLKNNFNSNALHFAAYASPDKIDYLLELGFSPDEKNCYEDTPFQIALDEKNIENVHALLKSTQHISLSQFLKIIKLSSKNIQLIDYVKKNIFLIKKSILNDEDNKKKALMYIYYYAQFDWIEKNKDFIQLLDIENIDKNILYFSSIAGRRDFLLKTEKIVNDYGWKVSNNRFFKNFHKEYPAGFLTALTQLPKTQFETLVKKNNILEKINPDEYIIFYLICLSKNSHEYESLLQKITNEDKYWNQKSFFLNNISSEIINENISLLSNLFISNQNTKNILIEKVSKFIYENNNPLNSLNVFFNKKIDKNLKIDIFHRLNELYFEDKNSHILENIFIKKYKIFKEIFEKKLKNSPENIKNIYSIKKFDISLDAYNYFRLLEINNFNEDYFLPKEKVKDLQSFIKSESFKKYNFKKITSSLGQYLMEISPKDALLKIFYHCINHADLRIEDLEKFIQKFPTHDLKEICELTACKFILDKGDNYEFWNFLEKINKNSKWFNLENTISHENLFLKKINEKKDISYINVFINPFMEKYNSLDVFNTQEFDKKIAYLSFNIPNFSQFGIADFLSWANMNNHFPKEDMGHLNILMNHCHAISQEDYKKIFNIIEDKLLISTKLSENELQIIDKILNHSNEEIRKIVFDSFLLKEKNQLLSKSQQATLFNYHLKNTLNNENHNKKTIKI